MKRVLLIQLRQLGDIILTTPCIREIKRERPEIDVAFLSHSMGNLVLEKTPYLGEYFYYDQAATRRFGSLQLLQTLRSKRYDLVIDFMNNPRSALLALATGAPVRLAFDSKRRFAYTKTIPRAERSDYIVREKFRLLREAGFSPASERLTLPWFESHTAPLMSLIGRELSFRDASYRVVLSPTHRREARRWPVERYAELADRLVRGWGAQVVWIWGPGEEEFVDAVMKQAKEPTLKAPKTSFRELAALIANCDLFIGNSNGPSHVAVATDVPSLQLHGPTEARAWCPMTDRHRAVQSQPAGEANGPMASIEIERVWQELEVMRPVIEEKVGARRKTGVRLNWMMP